MRDIAFIVGLLVMLPFAIGRPHIGALLWCWTAMLVPNAYVYGIAAPIRFNLIVVLITLIIWVLSKEPVRVPMNRTIVLLIIFGILGTISALFAIGTENIAWEHWERFSKIILFAVVVGALFNSRGRIEALIYAIILSVGFHGVEEGLKFIVTGGDHRIFGPGTSILADNNAFALAMLCTLPLVFFLYRQASYRALRFTLLGGAGVLFFTVVGTFSRGGLIGLLAIAFWAFLHSARKVRYLAMAIPLAILLVSFAPDRWTSRMDTISTADEDTSFMGRVIAWKQSTLIALDHPILGGGFHAVQDFTVWTQYRQMRFDELDFIPTDQPDPLSPHAAHSIYFQVLGDMGFVGLILFGLIGLTAWRNTIVVTRKAKGRADLEWAGQLAQYIQYSFVAYFVAGAALSMAYFELMYIQFAMIASLRMIVDRETSEPIPASATRR
jgi:probable O-glycosylation ligase (exosortase A-associated)